MSSGEKEAMNDTPAEDKNPTMPKSSTDEEATNDTTAPKEEVSANPKPPTVEVVPASNKNADVGNDQRQPGPRNEEEVPAPNGNANGGNDQRQPGARNLEEDPAPNGNANGGNDQRQPGARNLEEDPAPNGNANGGNDQRQPGARNRRVSPGLSLVKMLSLLLITGRPELKRKIGTRVLRVTVTGDRLAEAGKCLLGLKVKVSGRLNSPPGCSANTPVSKTVVGVALTDRANGAHALPVCVWHLAGKDMTPCYTPPNTSTDNKTLMEIKIAQIGTRRIEKNMFITLQSFPGFKSTDSSSTKSKKEKRDLPVMMVIMELELMWMYALPANYFPDHVSPLNVRTLVVRVELPLNFVPNRRPANIAPESRIKTEMSVVSIKQGRLTTSFTLDNALVVARLSLFNPFGEIPPRKRPSANKSKEELPTAKRLVKKEEDDGAGPSGGKS